MRCNGHLLAVVMGVGFILSSGLSAPAALQVGRGADDSASDGRGLRATIYEGTQFNRKVTERIDSHINFIWGYGSPHPSIKPDHYSIRWEGWFKAPKKGKYKLVLCGDDGVKLWLDDKLTIDQWPKGGRQESLVTVTGEPQKIRIEYVDFTNFAFVSLHWIDMKTGIETVVPPECFFHDEKVATKTRVKPLEPAKGRGLLAEYYTSNFKRKFFSRREERISTLWDTGSPAAGMPRDHFAVRWTSWIKAPSPGKYRLITYSDDGVRVWFDGTPVIDNWRNGKNRRNEIILEFTDQAHALKVEYYDAGAWAHIGLCWEPIRGAYKEQIIPASAFFTSKKLANQATPEEKKKP